VIFTEDPYDYINTTNYDLYVQQSYVHKRDRIYEDDYIRTLCDMGIVYARYNGDAHIWCKNIPYILAGKDGYHTTDLDSFAFITDSSALIDMISRNRDKITLSTCYKDNKKDGFFNIKILDQELFLVGKTICCHKGMIEKMISGEHRYIMAHPNYYSKRIEKISILKEIKKFYVKNIKDPLSTYGEKGDF
jgi:hypothetical protein